jgi:transcriptional regulator with XRE-family HTH domain
MAATLRRTRTFPVMTPLRALRLEHGLVLSEVARRAGMSLWLGSKIERDPLAGNGEEATALRKAIAELVAERKASGS